jgi:hypothetical protein
MVGTAAGSAVAFAVAVRTRDEWPIVVGYWLAIASMSTVLVHAVWMRQQAGWLEAASRTRKLAFPVTICSLMCAPVSVLALLAAVLTLAESYRDMGRLIRKRVGSVAGGVAG